MYAGARPWRAERTRGRENEVETLEREAQTTEEGKEVGGVKQSGGRVTETDGERNTTKSVKKQEQIHLHE